MKVLMFGWEFPPFNSGGLGTACYGLVKALSKKNAKITLILPFPCETDLAKVRQAKNSKIDFLKIKRIDALMIPYITSSAYETEYSRLQKSDLPKPYSSSLIEEVKRYALASIEIAQEEDFDVIHAHDWLTYEAGIIAKKISGKPLVVHVHATEFDRCGGPNINTQVYEIEKAGMEQADLVITVSNYTKQKVMEHYSIPSEKISVVHNSIEPPESNESYLFPLKEKNKIVLFLGRITIQKGPINFVHLAKKISEYLPNVKFMVVGDGDMKRQMIDETARLNLLDKFIYTGFLRGKDLEKAYRMADVYVMPSVSEPFGLTALESVINGTPALITKQSGVSEVMNHSFKVDFWDTDEMANKIISLLKYKELSNCMTENSQSEIRRYGWDESALKCLDLYQKIK